MKKILLLSLLILNFTVTKVFSKNKDISLKSEVKETKLYEYLFSDKMNNKNEMEKVIFSFIQ